jgi:hypothetical protein
MATSLLAPLDAEMPAGVQSAHHRNDGLFRHTDSAGDFLAALPGSAVLLHVIEIVADAISDLEGASGQLRVYKNLIEPAKTLLFKFRALP